MQDDDTPKRGIRFQPGPLARSRIMAIDLPKADIPEVSALLDKHRLALETVEVERRIASLKSQLGLEDAARDTPEDGRGSGRGPRSSRPETRSGR
jgi:hypothetical protein